MTLVKCLNAALFECGLTNFFRKFRKTYKHKSGGDYNFLKIIDIAGNTFRENIQNALNTTKHVEMAVHETIDCIANAY